VTARDLTTCGRGGRDLYTDRQTHIGPVAPTKLKFKYHLNPEIIVN